MAKHSLRFWHRGRCDWQEEKKSAETAKERKEQKQKIMAILASKQDEALHSKSSEELEKMLDELG